MVSLTTVYIVSVLLTSIAGIGSSFAANKIIGGSQLPVSVEKPEPEPEPEDYVREEFPPQPNTEQTEPATVSQAE